MVGQFARHFSIEVTRPTESEVTGLADIVPAGTLIYFSAVPTVGPDELVAAATSLRKVRLEPVIHVAARRIATAEALQDLLARLRGDADVRQLLVIGGDVDAVGPFADALAVIQKGRLREAGINAIGIAAYPEGHIKFPADRMEAALDAKIAAARAAGLQVRLVSQFSFSPEAVVGWLKRLRQCGIALPVSIGLAGPTSLTALLRFAKRCGVNASMRGLTSGIGSGLIGNVGPDRILDALAETDGIGEISPHYFSFGGILQTARYAVDAAHRLSPAGANA